MHSSTLGPSSICPICLALLPFNLISTYNDWAEPTTTIYLLWCGPSVVWLNDGLPPVICQAKHWLFLSVPTRILVLPWDKWATPSETGCTAMVDIFLSLQRWRSIIHTVYKPLIGMWGTYMQNDGVMSWPCCLFPYIYIITTHVPFGILFCWAS